MQFSGIDLDADGSANGKKHLINPGHFLKIHSPLQQLSALARAARCTIPANRIEIPERQAGNPRLTNVY
jgi:hypothetical protein